MVDLPRYVKPQRKPNGRQYYYYEKFRGRTSAWPRVPIGVSPDDETFWRRSRLCSMMEAMRGADGWTWLIRPEAGGSFPIPAPGGDVERYWTAVDTVMIRASRTAAGDAKTFGSLIADYKDHAAYKELSDSTKRNYNRYIDQMIEIWGADPVSNLTTVDAQSAIDLMQETPRSAEFFRMVLIMLIDFGIPRGYATFNPADKTEKPRYKPDTYKPWPDWAFELFFEHTRVGLHLPVYSALYTGQRSVDVITMIRPRREAGAIELIARKTGAQVHVPIHSDYRAILNTTHVDHVRLHLREDGAAWTLAAYRTAWQRELCFGQRIAKSAEEAAREADEDPAKAAAMARLRSEGLVFHGFRKNAVNMLLEVGSTEAEVSAIVEMSEAMVRHYSKGVNKRRLAENAMRKLEVGWNQTRQNLFGGATSPILRNGQ